MEYDKDIPDPDEYYQSGIIQALTGLGISLYIPYGIGLIAIVITFIANVKIGFYLVVGIISFIAFIIGLIVFLGGMGKIRTARPYARIIGSHDEEKKNNYDDFISMYERCRICQGLQRCSICDATGICHVCMGKVLTDKKTGHTKTCPLCGGSGVCYHCRGKKKCPQYHK